MIRLQKAASGAMGYHVDVDLIGLLAYAPASWRYYTMYDRMSGDIEHTESYRRNRKDSICPIFDSWSRRLTHRT
jgi:hypothetical protein